MNGTCRVNRSTVEKLMGGLGKIGFLGDGKGYLRAAWSPEESAAMKLISDFCASFGASHRFDSVGNLFVEIPGETDLYIEIGSHLDTVVNGGNYDGACGIVAGALTLEEFSAYFKRQYGLRLCIWRGEESSTFGTVFKGSLAAFGSLPAETLDRTFRGTSLRDAIRSAGFSPDMISSSQAEISPQDLTKIVCHLELHIEQANVLDLNQEDVGIITSIRTPFRFRVELIGSFDHSGGTPLGVAYRKDANLALAYILVELDRLINQSISDGQDLVQTIGVINSDKDFNDRESGVYQNGTSKVSGFSYFHFEFRGSRIVEMLNYEQKSLALISDIAKRFGVECRITEISKSKPISELSQQVISMMQESAEELGYRSRQMASGATHDCVVVGNQTNANGRQVPVGMIFIPCKNGISHSPEEFSTIEQIARGTDVLLGTVRQILELPRSNISLLGGQAGKLKLEK